MEHTNFELQQSRQGVKGESIPRFFFLHLLQVSVILDISDRALSNNLNLWYDEIFAMATEVVGGATS